MAVQTTGFDLRKYLFILKRRAHLSASVFLVVLGVGLAYCLFWPPIYQATCLVVVQPQKVPTEIVATTVTSKIQERLQIITQQVLSRTRLMELIERFNLYPNLRQQFTPDDLAQYMRKDIAIKITSKNYFTIEYLYQDAPTVASVTNALAAFYVDSNLRLREEDAVGTARFLTRELERMRNQITEWESKIARFKEEHLQELPEFLEKNLHTLDQLQLAWKHNNEMIQSELTRISSLEQEQGTLEFREQTLSVQRAHIQSYKGAGAEQGKPVDETEPEAIKREIEKLRVLYTENHPDIQRMQGHLAKAEALRADKMKRLRAEAAASGKSFDDMQMSELDLEAAAIRQSKERLAKRIVEGRERVKRFEAENEEAMRLQEEVRRRIENGPGVSEKLDELTRGYDAIKKAYEKLQGKALEANMSANLERTQRGEQFEVVDPAEVPDSPFRPNLKRSIPASFGLALLLGLALSLGLNYLDNSFTSVEQMERLGTFPVLVVLPPLVTKAEANRRSRRTALLGIIYGAVFLVLMLVMALLISGYGPAVKRLVSRLLGMG